MLPGAGDRVHWWYQAWSAQRAAFLFWSGIEDRRITMVKLNKIYTRTGDDGSTGLVGGGRISKADARVEAYGTVDEANACIGLAIVALGRGGAPKEASGTPRAAALGVAIAGDLASIQHDLFDAGADLATPMHETHPKSEASVHDQTQSNASEATDSSLRIVPAQVDRLETLIDRYNEGLTPLTSFVLPGGSEAAARLHVARAVVRRAERLVVGLAERDSHAVNAQVIRYLNRLSDLLFVLGRVANGCGADDVLWKPGKNREAGREAGQKDREV